MIHSKRTKSSSILPFILALTIIFFITLACGSTSPEASPTLKPSATFAPTPTAVKIPFDEISFQVSKRVIVQGYLAPKAVFSCSTHTPQRCYIPFAETAENEAAYLLCFIVSESTSANRMQSLPDNFKISDMVFYDDDLQPVRKGDLVQVTGTVIRSDSRLTGFEKGTPYIYVEKLELVP